MHPNTFFFKNSIEQKFEPRQIRTKHSQFCNSENCSFNCHNLKIMKKKEDNFINSNYSRNATV